MVYLVDDEDVVRDALAWLLRTRRLLSESFHSAESFDEMLAQQSLDWPQAPCCLILDVRMPGMSGPELFERLVAKGITAYMPVIFLTGHGEIPIAVAAIKNGAFDFVEKPFSDNRLVDRVEEALKVSAQALQSKQAAKALTTALTELTQREVSVMHLIAQGMANKEIAEQLDISVRTVEVHRARVFEKLDVKSAVDLVNVLRDQAPDSILLSAPAHVKR
jgi:two-component system response regulator DctR